MRAIALFSGGLDSTLAASLVRRLGVDVVAIHVGILFGAGSGRQAGLERAAEQAGVPLRVVDRSEEHLAVVRHPRHGRGSGMNPCVDCRVFMLRVAREEMEAEKAQFVITGEVLGQRPMSQNRRALTLEAEESGLGDRLLRPLSARLLPETRPVHEGWVPRDGLLALSGRGREAQARLAEFLGITEYPQPAGGCLLVEKVYSARLRDAFAHVGEEAMGREEFLLLRYGRQFRLSARTKVIVGRDEEENACLDRFARGRIRLEPIETMGPVALVEGAPPPEELELAASLVARYCDRTPDGLVALKVSAGGDETVRHVTPLGSDDPRLARWRIEAPTR